MVRRRMPLPATWFMLCHVDSSGKFGSGSVACPHSQASGRFWRSLSGRWTNGDDAGQNFRCRKFSSIFGVFAATASSWTKIDSGARQRTVAPCEGVAALAQQVSTCFAIGFSPALQSGLESNRKSMEADASFVHAQYLLSNHRGFDCSCSEPIYEVVSTQSPTA